MADEEKTTIEEAAPAEEATEEKTEKVSAEPKGAGLRFKKSKGVCRKCRRAGEKLFLKGERCFSAKCSFTRRSYAPGQHGNKGSGRLSQYGLQLREKQKLAAIYNLRGRQLLRYFELANKKKGKTGEILMILLERRLDNVIYRVGLAQSRRDAKQKIANRQVIINKKVVNAPSYLVKVSDVISLKIEIKKEKNKKEEREIEIPKWLSVDVKKQTMKVLRMPKREDIRESIEEQLIVEFYSK